ncbi:uncharacterized protein LY79DRAFT_666488 [Colletotrichum navitas]|uniref:ABC transporter domain-containing protein n=1 Tax=Colletotrichum navitas TaxID=681940 RepID=A0AAD8Q954_9PEZI|nr:uncharacterized protein LY79DRAFT_666488 [Colletotrichum navitas]KAK1597656.1 hypothetical protein LY79DRAFT_666488 [Colletotrichum navitas]
MRVLFDNMNGATCSEGVSDAGAYQDAEANELLRLWYVGFITSFLVTACHRFYQPGLLYFIAYSANTLAHWQGSTAIAASVAGTDNGTSVGDMHTVIFLIIDTCVMFGKIVPLLPLFGSASTASHKLRADIDSQSNIDSVAKDHDIRTLNVKNVRGYATLVRQKPSLLARPKHGLKQAVGDGDKFVSGGQKQRVTLWRALIRNPKILILDEVIASADSIIPMNAVDFIKEGTHADLIVRNGTNANLVNLRDIHVVKEGELPSRTSTAAESSAPSISIEKHGGDPVDLAQATKADR